MNIPENLRELVDRLGQALVQALATDPASRALAREIQGEGFEVSLMLEATVALHRREDDAESESDERPEEMEFSSEADGWSGVETSLNTELDRSGPQWSEEDRAFLHTFKISLD